MIGKTVTVTVDRPLGTFHPKHPDIFYPVNYGYIEGIFAGDGEEQDAYILGVEAPVEKFTGRITAGTMWRTNGWWPRREWCFPRKKLKSKCSFRNSTSILKS